MKFQVILLILPYTVFGAGVDQPGKCEETNKKIKPQSTVTLSSLLGKQWDLAEYGDKPIQTVCAHFDFVRVNGKGVNSTRTYQTKKSGKKFTLKVYVTSTGTNGKFKVTRKDATGLHVENYFGFAIYDDGDMSVWYTCRDLGNNKHQDAGYVLKRRNKKLTGIELEAAKAAYVRNGLNSHYVQKVEQDLPQCHG